MTDRRLLIASPLIVLAVFACGKKKAPPAPPPAPVAAAPVAKRTIDVRVEATGTVEAGESAEVRAQVGGVITEIHFKEGAEVAKGAPLLTLDPRPYQLALRQADAKLTGDRAQLRNAEEQEARYAGLADQEYVTREAHDRMKTTVADLRGKVASDLAEVEQARLRLDWCTVRAPIAGRTGDLRVRLGNLVAAGGEPLLTVNKLKPVRVAFTIPESDLAEVRKRAALVSAGLPVSAGPRGGTTASGRLRFIDNAVDRATGTVLLKAEFANEDGALWPGQFVSVTLALDHRVDAVAAPDAAVQAGQNGEFVYVVEDGKARLQPVKTGPHADGFVVIENGLRAGETVVTDGQLRLFPGAPVAVKDAPGGAQ